MEVKRVIKLFFLLMVVVFSGNAQEKYLLYNPEKDSIIRKGDIKYYKIGSNLFDIERYSQQDTINLKEYESLQLTSLNLLWKEGRKVTDSVIKNMNPNEPIILDQTGIETYNDIFKYIYILEKLPDCNYKRTRVWWIDY